MSVLRILARPAQAGLCLALCAPLSAMADTAGKLSPSTADLVVKRIYMQLDCDLDGTVEPDEVDEHFAQVWAPIDRDGSRTLSASEYERLVDRPAEAGVAAQPTLEAARTARATLFRDADADGNAAIDPREMRAHLRRLIVLADRNGDYEVTRPEVGLAAWPTARNRARAPGTRAGSRPLADH